MSDSEDADPPFDIDEAVLEEEQDSSEDDLASGSDAAEGYTTGFTTGRMMIIAVLG